MKNQLDLLNQIIRADAPDNLLTSIQQKIELNESSQATPSQVLAMAFVLILFVTLNFYAAEKQLNTKSKETDIVSILNISTNNNLYQ